MSKQLDLFIKAIKDDLLDNGEPLGELSKGTRFYYYNNYHGSQYGDNLKQVFEKRGIMSKEFTLMRKNPNHYKICSIASSARLCFLYFQGDKNIEFEAHLQNPTGSGNPSQPDAYDKENNIFYECKCQEIVDGENETLSESYAPLLKTYFNIDKININIYEKNISAYLPDWGIDYNEDYDKTHFNVKQLFTHLLALAKEPNIKNGTQLQYIFFTPKDENLKIYKELKAEIKAIWESEPIRYFLTLMDGKILLPPPKYQSVNEACFAVNPKTLLYKS